MRGLVRGRGDDDKKGRIRIHGLSWKEGRSTLA